MNDTLDAIFCNRARQKAKMKNLMITASFLFCVGCATSEHAGSNQATNEQTSPVKIFADANHPPKHKGYLSGKVKAAKRITNHLKRSGKSICKHTTAKKHKNCNFVKIKVKRSTGENLFTYNKNQTVIHPPIFDYVENDHELALIIAHEMGHHLAKHVTGHPETTSASRHQRKRAGLNHYDIDQELEADYIGSYLVAKAGYDLRKARLFFVRMQKLSLHEGVRDPRLEPLWFTHPLSSERLTVLRIASREIRFKQTRAKALLPN